MDETEDVLLIGGTLPFQTDEDWTMLYHYYEYKGIGNLILTNCINILTLFFITGLTSTVLYTVDWVHLLQCHDVENCGILTDFILQHDSWNIWTIFVYGNLIVSVLHGILTFLQTAHLIGKAMWIKKYLKATLRIRTNDLQTMSWTSLVERICEHHGSSDSIYPMMTQKILKLDHLVQGLVKNNIIPMKMPFTRFHGWILHKLLHNADTITIENFKMGCKQLGIIMLILTPFTFIASITYFAIRQSEELYTKKNYIGPRVWTFHARVLFQRYNEFPHDFEIRMVESLKHAHEYVLQFPMPMTHTCAKFISFAAVEILVILSILGILDENILYSVTLGGRHLWFYTVLFTAILAWSQSYMLDPSNLPYTPDVKMENLVKCIRYFPTEWNNKVHTFEVQRAVFQLYKLRFINFVIESIGVLFTPYFLLVILHNNADTIINHIRIECTRYDGSWVYRPALQAYSSI